MTRLYENAFGTDRESQLDPAHPVALAGLRRQPGRFGPVFTDAPTEAGWPSRVVHATTPDHGQIHSDVGMLDEPMTELIMRFQAGEGASQFPAESGGWNSEAGATVEICILRQWQMADIR